jgi:hypothetical protein
MGSRFENIEVLLRQYRENKSDYEICLKELMRLEQQLILHEKGKVESKDEIIEGLCNHAPILSAIPKSITNKFSSMTEDAVMNYRYYLQPSLLEITAINETIKQKSRLLMQYHQQIELVEDLLSALNDQERFIVETIYIKGFNQRQSMQMFNAELPQCFIQNKETFIHKKFKALAKMMKRLK